MLPRNPNKPAKPMVRKVPLRAFRKKRRPGNRKPTASESARMHDAKWEGCCIPCLVWARKGNMPLSDVARVCEYDHKKSGNIRRGHRYGYAACLWHHKRRLHEGWTFAAMTAHFGPSLMDGSRLFRDTYGDDDSLIALQDELLTRNEA